MNVFRDAGNILVQILPVSRCFRLKRFILALMGVDAAQGVSINGHTWFYGRGNIRIGKDTWIGPGCRFYATAGTTIDIGANCDIAPEVSFVTGTHDLGTAQRRAGPGRSDSISIGEGCWLGARATILGGVRIGRGSVVAACALVLSNLPEDCVAAGVPASPRKRLTNDDVPSAAVPVSDVPPS
jgi:maltose O-acetyltransferase